MVDLNRLAKMWSGGLDGSISRLRDLLENNHRFDARDREALAYLILAVEKSMEEAIDNDV